MVHDGVWSGWGAARLRRRVAALVVVLVAALAVATMAAPGDAQAFAWKDVCQVKVYNDTGSLKGLLPGSPGLLEVPPNPFDVGPWTEHWVFVKAGGGGFPQGNDGPATFTTAGIPLTWGCQIRPVFRWGGRNVSCTIAAPSSGRNTFKCDYTGPEVVAKTTTDNDDIKGTIDFRPPPVQVAAARTSGLRASSAAVPRQPKRVRALLRRRDLPGRGWRVADKVTQFGRLGKIFAANDAPASCKDDKTSEPLAKRGGASAFARRSNIIGYEHGVYASRRKSRARLRAAVSAHSIRCLARLLTSAQFHTHARFARYSLPGVHRVRLWRVVVRTRAGGRLTRTDYVDVAGLLHGRSNGLVIFAKPKKPVSSPVERSVIRTVARRLP